ncbi:hypothetical protein KPL74_04290 [Bacillus sp. NP157]|nr:hypothetical protein KPL74_04290 [Bacillus sp. NP157]
MHKWITLMAGGPQDGQQFSRAFDIARASPPPMRAADGLVCCPVAMRALGDTAFCVVVHPEARDEQIENAIDCMVEAAQGGRISGK